jgi:hypothetical protein
LRSLCSMSAKPTSRVPERIAGVLWFHFQLEFCGFWAYDHGLKRRTIE